MFNIQRSIVASIRMSVVQIRTTTICLSSRMGSLDWGSSVGCSASTMDWSRSWEWTDSGIVFLVRGVRYVG